MGCWYALKGLKVKRGTTPTVTFYVDFDLTIFDKVRIAFTSGYMTFVKEKDEISLRYEDGKTYIAVPLTQQETLSWKPGRKVEVQVRYKHGESADATEIGVLEVGRILEEGAI